MIQSAQISSSTINDCRELSRTSRVRLVIADDHPVIRDGLAALFAREPGIEVVGCAGTALAAEKCVCDTDAQLLVLDLSLGCDDGFELAQRLLQLRPKLKIVVLSMHDELQIADRLQAIGVASYVSKTSGCDEFLRAVRAAIHGKVYMTNEQRERAALIDRGRGPSPEKLLSARELTVFRLLARGMSSTEIATQLTVAAKTVHSHRRNIGAKLSVKSGREMIRYAVHWARSLD